MTTIASSHAEVHPMYDILRWNCFVLPGDEYPHGWQNSTFDSAEVRVACEGQGHRRFAAIVPCDWLIVDCDPRNNGMEAFVRLCNDIGVNLEEICYALVESGSGGWHVYLWGFPADLRSRKTLPQYRGLDFLRSQPAPRSSSVNVIGAGSLPKAGQDRPYRVVKTATEEGVGRVPQALVDLLGYEPTTVERGEVTSEDIKTGIRALECMPSSKLEDRDDWIRIGMAARAVGEELLDAWIEASSRAEGFVSEADCVDRWMTLQPSGEVGLGTLIFETGPEFRPTTTPEEAFGRWIGGAEVPGGGGGEGGGAGSDVGGAVAWPQRIYNFRTGGNNSAIPISMPAILAQLASVGLQTCAGTLFYHGGAAGRGETPTDPVMFSSASQLFAFLRQHTQVDWRSGSGSFTTKEELFEALRQSRGAYESIEAAPHFPPVGGSYYLRRFSGSEAGLAELQKLIGLFSPRTEMDRQLMLAAILTPFWGGPGGQRPMFVVTSEDGVGSGKTTFCQTVAMLTGLGTARSFQVRTKGEFDDLPRKMGSVAPTSPAARRQVVVDNFKGALLGAADIESMLTEETLSVWKLYHGEVDVVNRYTWFVTGNYLDLSDDLATRAVEIQLVKPFYSSDWEQKLRSIDHELVLEGIAAIFDREPVELGLVTRFPLWCRGVLGRIGGDGSAAGLIDLILHRSQELSVEDEDGMELKELLERYTSANSCEFVEGKILIRASHMVEWLIAAKVAHPAGSRWNARSLGKMFRRHAKSHKLIHYRTNSFRGWLWDRGLTIG